MKRNKKGFTIVELVIVIAVIAILAAVLIPTFSSLINKAKESSDTALVKNLNIIMAADEAENGKSETMSEALAAAESAGYTIEKITPTSSGDILWDEQNNRFVLKKADGTYYAENGNVTEGVNLWKITDDLEEVAENSNHYSYYLKGTEITEAVTAKAGVDVGENSADVNYANDGAGQTVTIRMNGGKLTVDAPNDTVNSYGEKESVDITAVASASYHENGKVVGNIEVKKGRVELGAGAEVNTVLVSSKAVGNVKVDVLAGAKVGSVAPTTEKAKEDIAASTSIPADSRVEEVVGEEVKSFAGGIGTENSPYLIATAEQFKNIKIVSSKNHYFKLIDDIDLIDVKGSSTAAIADRFSGTIDGNNHVIKIGKTENTGNDDSRYLFYYNSGNAVFKNMILEEAAYLGGLLEEANYICDAEVVFENITVRNAENLNATNTETYFGAFCSSAHGNSKIQFKNCNNYATIYSTGYTGFYVANYLEGSIKATFESCYNYGVISGPCIGLFSGNPANMDKLILVENKDFSDSTNSSVPNVFVENCGNTGIMTATSSVGIFSAKVSPSANKNEKIEAINNELLVNGRFTNSGVMNESSETVELQLSDHIVVYNQVIAGQSSYEIICQTSVSLGSGSGYIKLLKSTELPYISRIISDETYKVEFLKDYSSIMEQEQVSELDGWKYKIVELENNELIAVVNTKDLPSAYNWATDVVIPTKGITYILNVYNSDNRVIASSVCSADDLK